MEHRTLAASNRQESAVNYQDKQRTLAFTLKQNQDDLDKRKKFDAAKRAQFQDVHARKTEKRDELERLLATKADKGMTLDLGLRMKEDVLSKRYDALADELAEARRQNRALEAANRGREHELAIRRSQHQEKVANLQTDLGVVDGQMTHAEEEMKLWEARLDNAKAKAGTEEHDNPNANRKSRGKSRISLPRNSKLAKSSTLLATGPQASRRSLGLQKSTSMKDFRRRTIQSPHLEMPPAATIMQPASPTPRRHKSTSKLKRKQPVAFSDAAKTFSKLFERRKTATATQKALEVRPLEQHQLKKMLTIMNKSRTSGSSRIGCVSAREIPQLKNLGIDDIIQQNKQEKRAGEPSEDGLNESEVIESKMGQKFFGN